jgi:hypothetical protein
VAWGVRDGSRAGGSAGRLRAYTPHCSAPFGLTPPDRLKGDIHVSRAPIVPPMRTIVVARFFSFLKSWQRNRERHYLRKSLSREYGAPRMVRQMALRGACLCFPLVPKCHFCSSSFHARRTRRSRYTSTAALAVRQVHGESHSPVNSIMSPRSLRVHIRSSRIGPICVCLSATRPWLS